MAVGGFASANAQKNTVLLYGNAGYASSTVNDGITNTRAQAWGVNPGIGYQFSNHMTIGLQGGYNNMRTPSGDMTNTTLLNKDWSVGGFWRYTHYVGNIFFIYNQMELSYVSGSAEHEGLNDRGMYSGVAGAWFPAIGAFVHKGLALNFNMGGIGFSSVSGDAASTSSPSVTRNDFAITMGRQINMGVSINFGCKSKRHHGHHSEPGAEVRRMKIVEDEDVEADDDYSAKKARLKAKREKQKVRIKSGDDDE